jgi:hypothetical protein
MDLVFPHEYFESLEGGFLRKKKSFVEGSEEFGELCSLSLRGRTALATLQQPK